MQLEAGETQNGEKGRKCRKLASELQATQGIANLLEAPQLHNGDLGGHIIFRAEQRCAA